MYIILKQITAISNHLSINLVLYPEIIGEDFPSATHVNKISW